jgi:hypothetical protein
MKILLWTIALVLSCMSAAVQAQSSCSSDGQRPVPLLQERFTSADCQACWGQVVNTGAAATGTLSIDWIVPSARGDAAPLSAAANTDASARLFALGRSAPEGGSAPLSANDEVERSVGTPAQHALQGARLRVAHGLPFGGYIGTSVELVLPVNSRRPLDVRDIGVLKAHLLLVESIPAGVDGTPIARNLVRSSAEVLWDGREQLSLDQHLRNDRRYDGVLSDRNQRLLRPGARFYASQVLSIPEGAKPERLGVVGWVEGSGNVLVAAQSRCKP